MLFARFCFLQREETQTQINDWIVVVDFLKGQWCFEDLTSAVDELMML